MAIRPYPSEWETEAQIEPIGAICIRPIRPEDERLYGDFFAHVTQDDQRLRFFSAAPRLSHRFLATLTQIDYAREMAFVAIARQSGALIGVVRVVADPDYTRGEYAILLRSDLKGHGPRLAADAAPDRLRQVREAGGASRIGPDRQHDDAADVPRARLLHRAGARRRGRPPRHLIVDGAGAVGLQPSSRKPQRSSGYPGPCSAAGTYRKARLCACACSACTLRPG